MRPRNGFVLITMAAGALVLFGMLGLAFDIGRMYIAKNELQTFTDSAALSAALRLDGESSGITRARGEVDTMASRNRWAFGSETLTTGQRKVEFGIPQGGGVPNNWDESPGSAAGHSYARVWATVDVPIYFMTLFTGSTETRVQAMSVAGQVPVPTGYKWKNGLFPFSPIAHDRNGPDFGLEKGNLYTLRWPANTNNLANVCPGDIRMQPNGTPHPNQIWIDAADSRGSENRGYYGETSASIIRQQVQNDYQVQYFGVNDFVPLTGGQKQTERDAIVTRIGQDVDPYSATFDEYKNRGRSRRLVIVPIMDPTDRLPGTDNFRILGYGQFFLLTADKYESGANNPFCAEYVGPGAPDGGDGGGGNPGSGVTKVRLVI